eukprot:GEMP01083340.1.p1 GENE.GEMP01083340.1~~GEMP01083340.1.p1  ORF type:complete len:105 (+),score=21.96 GEMP01083340.1:161-475(+)
MSACWAWEVQTIIAERCHTHVTEWYQCRRALGDETPSFGGIECIDLEEKALRCFASSPIWRNIKCSHQPKGSLECIMKHFSVPVSQLLRTTYIAKQCNPVRKPR